MSFLKYQEIRASIHMDDAKSFGNRIKCLSDNERTGLMREYRAYHWLKAKYKKHYISMSSAFLDSVGIDIIIRQDELFLHFAVSGPADKELHLNCDYKIIVTDNKIYQQKVLHD